MKRARTRIRTTVKISRADFINGALAGTGEVLLSGAAPAGQSIADRWTGYGGVGDYAAANGNRAMRI